MANPAQAAAQLVASAALAAQKRRDWPEAAARWADLRAISPSRVDGYTRGIFALRQAGLADAADALLSEAAERFPGEADVLIALAQQAQRLGKLEEAASRWHAARQAAPGSSRTHAGYAQALRSLQRFEEAEAVMQEAMDRFPDNADIAFGHAAAAAGREDWPEAERRWSIACARFADLAAAHVGHARFWLARGEAGQARAVAEAAERRFPDDLELLALGARIARAEGRWQDALAGWRAVRARNPAYADAPVGIVEALTELEAFEEAADALRHLPPASRTSAAACWAEANLATRRGDLTTARALWQEASRRFPEDRRMRHGLTNTELRLTDQAIDAADGEYEAPPPKPDDATMAAPHMRRLQQIFAGFQSIGDSCEFGIVQRVFGVEPISLLRWTTMPLPHLIDVLASRFDGVGDPAQTILQVTRGEYRSEDTRFVMRMHTFIRSHEVSPEVLLPKLCARLRFLARKQIDDLTEASRTLVFRSSGPYDEPSLRRLHAELQKYGPNRLLIVTCAASGPAPGELIELEPFCLAGGIESLDTRRPHVPGWQLLCERVHTRFGGDGDPGGDPDQGGATPRYDSSVV
jgi:tetratricopeptide (TPR) repeat protein